MTLLEAIEAVLQGEGKPLHYTEITRRVLKRGLWHTNGKTPEATVNARLATHIKAHEKDSPFQRTGPGLFALRVWKLPESPRVSPPVQKGSRKPRRISASEVASEEIASVVPDVTGQTPPPGVVAEAPEPYSVPMSFLDAAERVLERFGDRKPMHYRKITEFALEKGWIQTQGKTPEASLNAQITTLIQRQKSRGETPRFVSYGKGFFGLSKWMGRGLAFQLEQHNRAVRKKFHEQLKKLDPVEFERLVGNLLVALGFEDVTVTQRTGDGGIDVRGTLVVGDVIRTRMAVQVKRLKNNVHSPVVQQVRGSLGTHEQGLIITTSDFSDGARNEANRPDAIPVALMDGEQLVKLLVEHQLGVRRTQYDLLEIEEDG